ncbi:uncharacterized protein EI97DRAFT_429731 [Westerdykella ornata]|uniref:Uncharacterized protein n=1 Tax=Westerdykella ornata TaxID=318751 RepID=A0A6A6JVY6_WESOR|nr:uncharacterized protein EI97DRAFT_429731 [Westerdykella ornata]KAF2279978.1 hypothetical protein EI97DRAFT_429731 [Westerdykella ornata]
MVLHWLQDATGKTSLQDLQLDIVGFLAILGEGSVLANAQVATLSRWQFLPRLIPAPQSLMRPTRPDVLEPSPGTVTGIFSGNVIDHINHIGNVVCDANDLPAHSVRVVSIRRIDQEKPLKARTLAPLTFLVFLGFALPCILLGVSIWLEDGMSILATILLSLLTSLIGFGNKWTLRLPKRRVKDGKVPRGDVVIRYPKGSFLIVRCDEDVARELYFAPETIEYLLAHGPSYRLLSLVGTMLLMGGIICLGNSQIETQLAWAGSYMLLNVSYWIVAALPSRLHWDTSAYAVENECLSDSEMSPKDGFPSHNQTFTQGLWKAIVLAKGTDWVLKSGACPDTEAWRGWLREAREHARSVALADKQEVVGGKEIVTWKIPDWNPQKALSSWLDEQAKRDEKSVKEGVEEV